VTDRAAPIKAEPPPAPPRAGTDLGQTDPAQTDYASMYARYWGRAERWGTRSYADPDELAARVLSTCGPGRLLDVGCGMGHLVRTLIARGVDAHGADVAAAPIAHSQAMAPGRFTVASVLALPHPDADFDTVVCTDCLEHIAEADVPAALAELRRVTRRAAYLTISTRMDTDGVWHLTVRDRAWWEARLAEAGFRRHPLAFRVVPFASLDAEGDQATIILEAVPPLAPRDVPDADPDARRDADAEAARALCAAEYVRPHDRVVVLGLGAGPAAHILRAASPADRVHPLEALSALDDSGPTSIDTLVFTAAAPPDEALLDRLAPALAPGGRLVLWIRSTTGERADPAALCARLAALDRFIPERIYRQRVGRDGGERRFEGLDPAAALAGGRLEADWWGVVAMRDPLAPAPRPAHERVFPDYTDLPEHNVAAIVRDYDNPWLHRAIVEVGMRCSDPAALAALCRRVLAAARPGSADEGAALCVLAYHTLAASTAPEVEPLLAHIARFDAAPDDTPHAWRWRVSTRFVAARLLLALGRRDEARAAFLRCAELDALRFSPLLATKTIDALLQAGLLAAAGGDAAEGERCWRRGLEEARRAVSGSWVNIWGAPDRPLPWGLHDISHVMDAASRCSAWLQALPFLKDRPALAFGLAQRQTFGETREWLGRLGKAKAWLEAQLAVQSDLSLRQERELIELAAWTRTQEETKTWLEGQREMWQAEAARREARLTAAESDADRLRQWTAQLEEAKEWLEAHAERWVQAAGQRDRAAREWEATALRMQRDLDALATAKAWLEGQAAAWQTTAEDRDRSLAELKSWAAQLEEAKAWNQEQAAAASEREAAARAETHQAAARERSLTHALHAAESDRDALRARLDQAAALWRAVHTPRGLLSAAAAMARGRPAPAIHPPDPAPGKP